MALSYVYQTIGAELAGNRSVDEFTALVRSEVSGAFRERQFFVALEDPHALERLCSEIAIAEGIKDCGVVLVSARAQGTGRRLSNTNDLRHAAKNADSSNAVRLSYQRDKKMSVHKHHSTLPASPETTRMRLAREQTAQANMQKKISSAVGSARDSSEKSFKERICGRLAESAVAPGVTAMGLIQRARDLLVAEADCWYTTPAVPVAHIAGLIGKDLARTVTALDPAIVKTARANSTLQRSYCANLERSEAWTALEHYSNVGRELQVTIDGRHGGGRGHKGGRGRRWKHGPRFYGGRSHRGWGWRNGIFVDFDLFPDEYDIYGQPIVYPPGPLLYAVPPPRPLLSFGAEAKPAQDIGARYYAGGYYPYSSGYATGYAPYYGQTVVAAPQPVVYRHPYAPSVVVGGFRRPRPLISIGGGRRGRGIFNIGEEAPIEAKMGGRTSTGRWTTSRESRSGGGRRSKMPPREPASQGSQRMNAPIAPTASELEIGYHMSDRCPTEMNNHKKEKKNKKDKKDKKDKEFNKAKNYSRPSQPATAPAPIVDDDDGWLKPTATQPLAAKPVGDVTFTPYPMPAARDKYPIAARVVAEQEEMGMSDDEDDMPLGQSSRPASAAAAAAQPAPQQQQFAEDRDDWSPTIVGKTIITPAGYVRVRITNLAYVGEKKRVASLYVTVARDGGQEKFIGTGIIFGSSATRELPLGPKYTFRFYAGPPGDNATAGAIKTIEQSFGKDGLYSITIRTAGDKQTKFRLRVRSIPGLLKNARAALVRSELSVPVTFTSTANMAYAIGTELCELRAGSYKMSVGDRSTRVIVHPETEYSVKLSGGKTVIVSVDEDNALAKMQRHDLSALQPIANSVMFVRKGQDLLVAPLSSFKTNNAPTEEYGIAVSKASAPTQPIGSVLMNPSHITVWSVDSASIAVHDVFTHPADSSTLVVVVDPHEIHP